MTDAQVLRRAAKVIQGRSTKPRGLIVRTLIALLCSIAADIEREEGQELPVGLLKVEPDGRVHGVVVSRAAVDILGPPPRGVPWDAPFTDFDG